MEKIVENLLRLFLLSSTVLGAGYQPFENSAVGSQFSIFKVDTKLGIFPLLITKYLQYIPQPTLRGHTMAEKLVLLDLTYLPRGLTDWPPFSIHSFPYSASPCLSEWFLPSKICRLNLNDTFCLCWLTPAYVIDSRYILLNFNEWMKGIGLALFFFF